MATWVQEGDAQRRISSDQLAVHLETVCQHCVFDAGVRRVLLLPPDHTRLHSMAGTITAWLWKRLQGMVELDIMPTLGTHAAMTEAEWQLMFGRDVPYTAMLEHRWREDLVELGTLEEADLRDWSQGRFAQPMRIAVNRRLVSGQYDLILSIGQVVPHEVIGFANYTKNVCIGAGGADMVHKSHFLGAVCNMETIMGRRDTPVRRAINAAFDRFVRPQARVAFLLTVLTGEGELCGFYGGDDEDCFRQACELSAEVNVTTLEHPIDKCVVVLDPREFKSTWLGNKAIYRTRMAMADEGELFVIAPGLMMFGEDAEIDRLIRKHGYRGTPATLAGIEQDPALGDNLAAAAHLIHGSSEGRFAITYCPGPGLSAAEIEGVGYRAVSLAEATDRFSLADAVPGWNRTPAEEAFYLIQNPGLGLWRVANVG